MMSSLSCFIDIFQNYPRPPPVGSRVRRGDDWKYGNQDGGSAGTVIKTDGTPGKFHHWQCWLWGKKEILTFSHSDRRP